MTAAIWGVILIALGAIVRYAINFEVAGIEEDVIGLILMVAGAAVLVLGLIQMAMGQNRGAPPPQQPRDPRYPPR